MSIKDNINEIIEDMELFDNWEEKYEYIIDLGKEFPTMPESDKNEKNLIHGCQSLAWFTAKMENGKCVFSIDADSLMVRGILSLLVKAFSNANPEEIKTSSLDFIHQIGLSSQLSSTRANSIQTVFDQMRSFAGHYQENQ